MRIGSSFLFDLTLNTSPKPHLQKVMPCELHPCHIWNLGLGTPFEVVSSNFHALHGWDCMDWPHVTWNPCELALKMKLKRHELWWDWVVCSIFIDIILGPMVNAIGFGMVHVDHLKRKKIFTLTSSNCSHFNSNLGYWMAI